MIGQTFSFSHCISNLLIFVAECVVSRDVHKYCGDTMGHGFYWKDGGSRKIVPQGP